MTTPNVQITFFVKYFFECRIYLNLYITCEVESSRFSCLLRVHSKRIVLFSASSFLLADKNKHKSTFYILLIVFEKVARNPSTLHHCTLTICFVILPYQYCSLSCFVFLSFFSPLFYILACLLCRAASCGCSCHFKRPAWCVRTPQYQNCRDGARHSILRPPHLASHLSLQEAAITQVRSAVRRRRTAARDAAVMLRPASQRESNSP